MDVSAASHRDAEQRELEQLFFRDQARLTCIERTRNLQQIRLPTLADEPPMAAEQWRLRFTHRSASGEKAKNLLIFQSIVRLRNRTNLVSVHTLPCPCESSSLSKRREL